MYTSIKLTFQTTHLFVFRYCFSEEHKHWLFQSHSSGSGREVVSGAKDQNGSTLSTKISQHKQKARRFIKHKWGPERNKDHASGSSRKGRETESGEYEEGIERWGTGLLLNGGEVVIRPPWVGWMTLASWLDSQIKSIFVLCVLGSRVTGSFERLWHNIYI